MKSRCASPLRHARGTPAPVPLEVPAEPARTPESAPLECRPHPSRSSRMPDTAEMPAPSAAQPAGAPPSAGKVTVARKVEQKAAPCRKRHRSPRPAPKLVPAAARRPVALVEGAVEQHRRRLHQAQARRGDAAGPGGRADPRRSRHGDGAARHRCAGVRPLRPRRLRGRGAGDHGRGGREGADAGGAAARARPVAQAACHPGGRRQRHRQDHDDRQARGQAGRRRAEGDAGGRRHVPRRGDRAAEDLGRAHRRAGGRLEARRRCGRPRLRRLREGQGRRAPTC